MTKTRQPEQRPVLNWSYKNKQYSYPVTFQDHLWWTRAIWREGAPQVTVGHTLLQRFTYLYSIGEYPTLTSFLRSYVQPINPKWFPGGKLSEAKIARLEKKGDIKGANAERARAKKRLEYSATLLAKIPSRYREIADRILAGETRSPAPGAMHFAASTAKKTDSNEVARQKAQAFAQKKDLVLIPIKEGYQTGLNWFFGVPGVKPPSVGIGSVIAASMLPLALIGLMITLFLFGKKPEK